MSHSKQRHDGHSSIGVGTTMNYGDISAPGAYVELNSGNLMRITADALQAGRSPSLWIESREPVQVRKISDNPFVTKTKAALLCADADVSQNFE